MIFVFLKTCEADQNWYLDKITKTSLMRSIECILFNVVLHFTPQMHTFFFFLILFHCLIFLRELVNGFLVHRVSSLEIVGLQSFCIMNISLKNWASLDNWQVWISLPCSTWNFEQLVGSVTWKVTIITEPLCGIQWTMKKGKKQEYSGLIQLPSSL